MRCFHRSIPSSGIASAGSWLFDFDYRIEIYVPKDKRQYGYYVLPFLLGDQIVGRCDLKTDRANGVLRLLGAFTEPGIDENAIAADLAAELQTARHDGRRRSGQCRLHRPTCRRCQGNALARAHTRVARFSALTSARIDAVVMSVCMPQPQISMPATFACT